MKNKYIFLVISLFCVFSIHGCLDETEKAVRSLLGKTLVLPIEIDIQKADYPYKIVSYLDPSLCDSCINNYLFAASLFLESLKNDSILFIAIKSERKESKTVDTNYGYFKNTIIIHDLDNKFFTYNNIEKYPKSMRTYLLDRKNHIQLVGDPLRNNNIQLLTVKQVSTLNNVIKCN